MLRNWKHLESLHVAGFSVDQDHPLTYSTLSLHHLRSLTFTTAIAISRPFIRHLIAQGSGLTYLDLTHALLHLGRDNVIVPSTLRELHCSDARLLTSSLPQLARLRIHAPMGSFDLLQTLPALRQFAFFLDDPRGLDDLVGRLSGLKGLRALSVYSPVAMKIGRMHPVRKECDRLGIELRTARQWSKWSDE